VPHPHLVGRWRRGLLRSPDGDDRASDVSWLQGPARYVDLRLPPSRPSVAMDPGLGDLVLIADRQGFAGTFRWDGDVGSWQRAIDLQPPQPLPDEGRLDLRGPAAEALAGTTDLLVETGIHSPYVEHWWRDADGDPPAACACGHDERGRAVVVVRTGRFVGLARDRDGALPTGVRDLAEAIRGAADVAAARRIADCEISWGTVDGAGWHLLRSTLPWREDVTVQPELLSDRLTLRGDGPKPDRWTLTEVTGRESLLRHPSVLAMR
jgi:hypothetical protein